MGAALSVPRAMARLAPAFEDIRIAVLDDHVVVRYGIELLIGHSPGYGWTGAASTLAELLRLLISCPCHVLVLDYQLSPDEIDGWSLVRYLRSRFPHIRILVYTSYDSIKIASIVRRAGAHGFLSKSAGLDPLLDTIRQLAAGETVYPAGLPEAAAMPDLAGEQPGLSPREIEVLRCSLQGMNVTSIAAKFCRSVKTISAQKQAGYRKLGVRNDHDFLMMYADARFEPGWLRLG
ncbi:response regulator [Xylophilus rhododendri]|uniref:Response regulator n=1 Tax=Xylophilus rhododendri TaxID=2697032 RepID=A0A857JA33_9BURK|nr:response regulator transcription factor [Xylophilus rhododendri]QHI99991.1 response regulator [Xylophilus rhododendri]